MRSMVLKKIILEVNKASYLTLILDSTPYVLHEDQ